MGGWVGAVGWFVVGAVVAGVWNDQEVRGARAEVEMAVRDRDACLAMGRWQDREILELRGGRDLRECRETAAAQRRVLVANGLVGGGVARRSHGAE